MWYIIISLIIIIFVGILITKIFDDGELGAISAIIAMFILGFIPIANSVIYTGEETEYQQVVYEITGLEFKTELKEKSGLTGAFLLGSGFATGSSETSKEIYYVFFANTQYGKQLQTIQGENIYIKETDDESPKLVKIMRSGMRTANIIDILWGHKKGEKIETTATEQGQILVVPTNTVKIDYNVEI